MAAPYRWNVRDCEAWTSVARAGDDARPHAAQRWRIDGDHHAPAVQAPRCASIDTRAAGTSGLAGTTNDGEVVSPRQHVAIDRHAEAGALDHEARAVGRQALDRVALHRRTHQKLHPGERDGRVRHEGVDLGDHAGRARRPVVGRHLRPRGREMRGDEHHREDYSVNG